MSAPPSACRSAPVQPLNSSASFVISTTELPSFASRAAASRAARARSSAGSASAAESTPAVTSRSRSASLAFALATSGVTRRAATAPFLLALTLLSAAAAAASVTCGDSLLSMGSMISRSASSIGTETVFGQADLPPPWLVPQWYLVAPLAPLPLVPVAVIFPPHSPQISSPLSRYVGLARLRLAPMFTPKRTCTRSHSSCSTIASSGMSLTIHSEGGASRATRVPVVGFFTNWRRP